MKHELDRGEKALLESIVDEGWIVPSDLGDADLRRLIYLVAVGYAKIELQSYERGRNNRYPYITPTASGRAAVRR